MNKNPILSILQHTITQTALLQIKNNCHNKQSNVWTPEHPLNTSILIPHMTRISSQNEQIQTSLHNPTPTTHTQWLAAYIITHCRI